MAIDKKTVLYTAFLARIELQDKELEKLAAQLQDILKFIDKISNLNTDKVRPTSHVLPINNVLREDMPRSSLSVDKALENAPQREGNFFAVPKVIE